jgi:tetratricopeptide (TPR) repeat protein
MLHGVLAAVLVCTAVPAHARGESGADSLSAVDQLRHEEGQLALQSGNFKRAKRLYMTLIRSNPKWAFAYREAGRALHALGQLSQAANMLHKAAEMAPERRDPELYYLLGEAYYALGKVAEARKAHAVVVKQVGAHPKGRMETLWLARVYARRGQTEAADKLYRSLQKAGSDLDIEVELTRAEAFTLAKKWQRAEQVLRHLINVVGNHPRANAMLAWVLEAEKKLDKEIEVRKGLAERAAPVNFLYTFDHARALERSGKYTEALRHYRQASSIDSDGHPELAASIARLRHRLSTELSTGGIFRTDPSGHSEGVRAGVAFAFGWNNSLSLLASYERSNAYANRRATTANTKLATLRGSFLLGRTQSLTSVLALELTGLDSRTGSVPTLENPDGMVVDSTTLNVAPSVTLRTAPGKKLQFYADAKVGAPWREAASTIREGGTVTGVTAQLYALPFGDKLVFGTGGRARYLELRTVMDETPTAKQMLWFAGADYVAWVDPRHRARGQILDENLAFSTYLADALVVSYRHYESFGSNDFGSRVPLADRAQVEEVSAIGRKTMRDGVLAFEGRIGGGYDWARNLRLWRSGASLLFSPTTATRITLTYDVATESSSGLAGRRHAGWLSFHADL